MEIGSTWNESSLTVDPVAGRRLRRLTTRGWLNQTPTYHTNSGFTADGRFLVLGSVREGATWILRAEVESGALTALWRCPGTGDRSYIHRGMEFEAAGRDGRGVCGNRVCVAPRTGWAVFACERRILAVSLHTGQPRVLLDDCGEEWIYGAPSVSPDERHVAITLSSAHPEILAGRPVTRPYLSFPDHRLRVVRAPMEGGGAPETLFEHAPAQSAHCAYSPTDPACLYFDLDLPPAYWCGSDGATPRIWLLDIPTGAARPLKHDYPGPFQTHQAWLWDGSALAYHGPLPGGGVYLGVARRTGETLWERAFPQAAFYGHVAADPARPALILDGDFSADLLQWLTWGGEPGAPPNLMPICRHGTDWESIPGQYSHPHPLADPTVRWISFNAARAGRTDVFVVDVRT